MVKLGARPVGLSAAVLGDLDFPRPQTGRVKAGASFPSRQGFRFSARASQLWRFSLGSNAAVIKKIGKGGTANVKELAAQMDYLFSKSAAIFGNGVAFDHDAKGLTRDERNEIVGDWVEDWRGSPKNGHSSQLPLSFPFHVRPEKAKLIAEVWAFEMFQSGEHQDDVWSYVAALHTDRAHPHEGDAFPSNPLADRRLRAITVRRRGSGAGDLDQLAAGMGPAMRQLDARTDPVGCDQADVSGIAIGL